MSKQQTPQADRVLVLLSAAEPGVSARHFVQVFSVCSTVFAAVDVATRSGDPPVWASPVDDQTAKWLAEKHQLLAAPLALERLDPMAESYAGLVVPDGQGFYFEPHSASVRAFLEYFVKFKRPICLIGGGTAALLSTEPPAGEHWFLRKCALTAPSNYDAIKHNTYLAHTSMEDFIVTCRAKSSVHIVVDDSIVTAQNRNCTLIAIQTFILLCNR
ncbi:hypothetical protein BC831DRAFT_465746 [Entophlyctis helioformis]|nr:hypothetical protein BC831DRAFT_465746 [Entophlyctis helioformis]